ncbi:MAG: phenylalanine--tRNA ligase subunit alpha [Deltaproteobacteria bacterium]|nr:phenylalanine--tRNA ligase subunit alpha [Deltaproteobacteria bacterium]
MSTPDDLDLAAQQTTALHALDAADSSEALEAFYRAWLSPSGATTRLKRGIGRLPADQRAAFGKNVNALHAELETRFQQRREVIKTRELAERIAAEARDVTLPARPRPAGAYHPVTLVMREVLDVFQRMGFSVFESPHVETDDYNFGLLNMPADHPARDMQDTFYLDNERLLRTHTSAGQIRAMRELGGNGTRPVRVVLPGLCYRNENITTRSEIQFHQVEGLLVGRSVRMSDLKGVLLQYARLLFGPDQQVRLRGSYFPFTEPSVEVDIRCTLCGGNGCRVCKQTGWLELLGAGMVHPVVLANGGYDPDEWRGFAFGMGIERTVLQRYDIHDIRYLFGNDLRLLQQFR